MLYWQDCGNEKALGGILVSHWCYNKLYSLLVLKVRNPQVKVLAACIPSRGSRGESISQPTASRGCLLSLAHGPIFKPSILFFSDSDTRAFSYKDPWDYIESTWIIQDDLPIVNIFAEFLLLCNVLGSWGPLFCLPQGASNLAITVKITDTQVLWSHSSFSRNSFDRCNHLILHVYKIIHCIFLW